MIIVVCLTDATITYHMTEQTSVPRRPCLTWAWQKYISQVWSEAAGVWWPVKADPEEEGEDDEEAGAEDGVHRLQVEEPGQSRIIVVETILNQPFRRRSRGRSTLSWAGRRSARGRWSSSSSCILFSNKARQWRSAANEKIELLVIWFNARTVQAKTRRALLMSCNKMIKTKSVSV